MSDLEKFDPAKLMDGVRDRVKATFVSLIPDEHWDKLVKAECDAFFRKPNDWNDSEFKKLVDGMIKEHARKYIREYLSQYHSHLWNDDGIEANEVFVKLLAENAQKIFASAFAGMFQIAVNEMQKKEY